MPLRIGLLPLARPTFDVPFAEEKARAAFAALHETGHDIVGSGALLFDAAATEAALEELRAQSLDWVLILQVTFTDATMTLKIAETLQCPLAFWAFPEERSGGRLRLNSFCGLNLASHALGRAGRDYSYLYCRPDTAAIGKELASLFAGARQAQACGIAWPESPLDPDATKAAQAALARLSGRRIGLVGRHPDGFETCRYEPERLRALAGVDVEPIELSTFFAHARAADAQAVAVTRQSVAALGGIDSVDQEQLDRSLTLFEALKDLKAKKDLAAFAVRCWPEMFTEYGCAACGPMAMMSGAGSPCACEADVMGALTSLLMQEIAGEAGFLVDIVDMDAESDTSVVWHCGLAPLSMCDPAFEPQATIHSNRRMPLLHHFPLKPGPVTAARLTQSRNGLRMALASGEMLRAEPSFSGTSGVVRFTTPAGRASEILLGERIEHHLSIVYGDHIAALRAAAAQMGIPAIRLA